MIIKTKGIVFRAKKYSETSLIVDVFTRAKGLKSYLISGVRSKKSRVSASLLQPMSIVELVVYHRHDRSLTRIKEIKPYVVYQSIPFEIKRGAVGLFMTEVAQKTIRETEENTDLFDFLEQYFIHLDTTDVATNNLHLLFMVQLSRYLGFIPGGTYSSETPLFDMKEGVFVGGNPEHTYYMEKRESELLDFFLNASIETCHQIQINSQERRILLRQLLNYYKFHIENLPDIHAHEILETVLK